MKGILFKPWKIVYIAEHPDIEIQTRRLGGLKLINDHEPDCWELSPANNDKPPFRFRDKRENIPHNERYFPIECKPRYQQGETVYIKEAFAQDSDRRIYYKLDYPSGEVPYDLAYPGCRAFANWRSPLFMPEWAARYFITITDVRAERLQGITTDACYAEGIEKPYMQWQGADRATRYLFSLLWNSINKDYPFESNPWVWVYTFRREK